MKINKVKLLVGTMAIAAVAATVGSISGTVAWFQYSTRSTVAYKGAAAHCTENLQIRINAGTESQYPWTQDLTSTAIGTYLTATRSTAANTLRPVTSGELAQGAVASTLYKNPIYQYPDMANWGEATATEDYVVIPLQLRVLDLNGNTTANYLAKKIYVTDVTIAADSANTSPHYDFSSAIRVGVSAAQAGATSLTPYATFSTANATNAATGIAVSGKLDLNNDGFADKEAGYDFQTGTRNEVDYGASGKFAKSTSNAQLGTSAAATDVGVANDTDPYHLKGKEIGSTTTEKVLNVEVKIYLEGWAEISDYTANVGGEADTDMKTIWDIAKSNGALFDVGIRFSAETHAATDA